MWEPPSRESETYGRLGRDDFPDVAQSRCSSSLRASSPFGGIPTKFAHAHQRPTSTMVKHVTVNASRILIPDMGTGMDRR